MGLFSKWDRGLRKTRKGMTGAIDEILGAKKVIDEDLYEELEEALVMGDVGVMTSAQIIAQVRAQIKKSKDKEPGIVRGKMEETVAQMLSGGEELCIGTQPSVILVIGVNGVGKTTTIGKLAARLKVEGKKVILGAADTFRAAAIEQLQEWADRAQVEIVKHKEGADPAAVVFDTIAAGRARGADVIICDTAGRLHNKKHLMDELNKIYRVIGRELPDADRECLLVLDATTGQNAVNQAREFKAVADLTGIVLTKLDGTARGGVVLAIKNELDIPVKFVGVGEQIDDLQPFDPMAFAKGLFLTEDEEDENAENGTDGGLEMDHSEDWGADGIGADNGRDEAAPVEEPVEGRPAGGADASDAPQEAWGSADAAGGDDTLQAGYEEQPAAQAQTQEAEELGDGVSEDGKKQKKERKKRFGFFNRNA